MQGANWMPAIAVLSESCISCMWPNDTVTPASITVDLLCVYVCNILLLHPPAYEEHYKMKHSVCLSVCPSVCRVPRPTVTRERKSPRSPKLAEWKPITMS